MTPEILRDRLKNTAADLGWAVSDEPAFVSKRFRARSEDSTADFPTKAFGLRLGRYPVIVAPIALGDVPEMQDDLRRLHSQLVIARSHMPPAQVINAHIFLCAISMPSKDWKRVRDLAERDEAVCRKLIWMPDEARLDQSYLDFVGGTFLAQPWRQNDSVLDAPLDYDNDLVERVLREQGLSAAAAAEWISLATQYENNPIDLVPQLVTAMDLP